MSPETSESVSDNSEITQLLSHDCRTISKNFREKKILSSKVDFTYLKSLRFWSIFHRSEKKWSFRLQTSLKNFLGVRWTCSKYLQCPPTSGLSNAPTLVTIRHTETKWCKKNKKRAPETPFEFHFSITVFYTFDGWNLLWDMPKIRYSH